MDEQEGPLGHLEGWIDEPVLLIRQLGIVEKVLVTIPERFEATVTSLENTKDLSKITLAELCFASPRVKKNDEGWGFCGRSISS
ncbi:hypothetical protein CR513_26882, partial [Mucuna pruriens]